MLDEQAVRRYVRIFSFFFFLFLFSVAEEICVCWQSVRTCNETVKGERIKISSDLELILEDVFYEDSRS